MEDCYISSSELLHILFKYANKPPRFMAEHYIDRDRTLVYKWLNNKGTPPLKLIPLIVKFAAENSSDLKRRLMREEIISRVRWSDLDNPVKDEIEKKEDFSLFLTEAFYLANLKRPEKPTGMAGGAAGGHMESGSVRVTTIPITTIIFMLLASTLGGFIWNILNHIFAWEFFLGGSGNEPTGILAFFWGIIAHFPAVLFAILTWRRVCREKNISQLIWLAATLYSIACAMGAFIFYNSGIRASIESTGLRHGPRELLIVAIYSAVISIPAYLCLCASLHISGKPCRISLVSLCIPIVLSLSAVTITLLVKRPEIEVSQLRGMLVGFFMRLGMYFAILYSLKADIAQCLTAQAE